MEAVPGVVVWFGCGRRGAIAEPTDHVLTGGIGLVEGPRRGWPNAATKSGKRKKGEFGRTVVDGIFF